MKGYRAAIKILTILLLIFIGVVCIDFLRVLIGSKPLLVHLHRIIFDAFLVSMIWCVIYIIVLYIEIISKRHWKKVAFVTIGMVIIITVYLILLDICAKRADLNAYKYVPFVFSSEKKDSEIRCDENIRKDYEWFSEHFDMKAIKVVKHYPIWGRHIFLVKSEGITPFVIDINISFEQKIFVWIHREKEPEERMEK